MIMTPTELIQKTIQNALNRGEANLSETKILIEKFKLAGFSVTDLETKQLKAEAQLEALRQLL